MRLRDFGHWPEGRTRCATIRSILRDCRARTRSLLCAVACGLVAAPAIAAADGPQRVLVIDTERADRPLWAEFSAGFRSTLGERSEQPVDIYFETLDLTRFGEPDYLGRVEAWLARKYRGMPPEVVVTAGPQSYRLLARWSASLPRDTSVVFTAVDPKTLEATGRVPRSTGLVSEFGHLETIRLAMRLVPGTRHLAVMGGDRESQAYSRFLYSEIVEAFGQQLEIIDLTGLPVSEMRARAAELPNETIMILASIFADGAGQPITHPELVAEIAPVASAPIFSFTKTELGHGTVGGLLFDPRLAGQETASLVARVLNGEPAASIEPIAADFDVLAFDWRQLERWGIPESRLPPESVVEFRPPSLWEEHRGAVLLALGVVGFQALSIVALVRSRERRRQINRELHRLSGRLITAQEDERQRVARELHDDISQRLALLAIGLESPAAEQRLAEAASGAQQLARDVHLLSHHLQPPRLEGSGLAGELRSFCDEVSERQELRVECRLPDFDFELPGGVALTLYRVAQEAVQNAARHSGADEVSVDLMVSPRWASITVADDGRGLDPTALRPGRGLGLASMRERVRMADGWLDVGNGPTGGATVSAWVPLDSLRGEGEMP